MKRKNSWDILKAFIKKQYIKKYGADDMDVAIRDLMTDLWHIRGKTDLSVRLVDAEEVYQTEQGAIDSKLLHEAVGGDDPVYGIFIVAPPDYSDSKAYPYPNSDPQLYQVCQKHNPKESSGDAYAYDRYTELESFGTMKDAKAHALELGCKRPVII